MARWVCPKCGREVLASRDEREQGHCSSCEVASWTSEKRAAIGRCIGLAFGKPDATEGEKDAAIREALKHYEASTPASKGGEG